MASKITTDLWQSWQRLNIMSHEFDKAGNAIRTPLWSKLHAKFWGAGQDVHGPGLHLLHYSKKESPWFFKNGVMSHYKQFSTCLTVFLEANAPCSSLGTWYWMWLGISIILCPLLAVSLSVLFHFTYRNDKNECARMLAGLLQLWLRVSQKKK